MVAIDQYADLSEKRSLARVIKQVARGALRDLAYPVFLYRRLRDGKIVDAAPTSDVKTIAPVITEASGPVRITTADMVACIHAEAETAVSIAGTVAEAHQDATGDLDWVAYELEAIRREFADDLHR